MAREIKFSLVYRDMWQSSGKYQPRVDQLEKIAPVIVAMGCFDRIETNGGAFEQVNLMYGENPNKAVRAWTKPFNQAGIQTHMLERALNGLRMYGVPADVRRLMPKVKKAQGVDIMRSFCGLNDPRNLELSVTAAKEAGMISQAALSITHSPIHTVEYYMGIVDKLVAFGADEICLKDMAGVGRPATLGRLVHEIKTKYPHIVVQYHGHTGPGLSMASTLMVAQAGADVIDCAMEPLSWGMVHPDVISVQAMLKDAGFSVKDINMDAYMEARRLTQEFIDDFLGLYINPGNRISSSLLVGCGLPGGMMGSMMSDLKGVHGAINMALKKSGKPEVSFEELTVQLFQEVEHIWPLLGYPPLVTPFSQYTKNIAVMNLLSMAQGKPRFSQIDKDSWSMILGRAGQLPGPLAPEIVELAKKQGMEFYTGVPQEAYPDALPEYIKEMEQNGWALRAGHARPPVPRLQERHRQRTLPQGGGAAACREVGRQPAGSRRRGGTQLHLAEIPQCHPHRGRRHGPPAVGGQLRRPQHRPRSRHRGEGGRHLGPHRGPLRTHAAALAQGRQNRRHLCQAGPDGQKRRCYRLGRVNRARAEAVVTSATSSTPMPLSSAIFCATRGI